MAAASRDPGTPDERVYDLIVIGTGNAGMPMALGARRAGWKVAIVDKHPYGGTCAVKGCIPKKVLIGAADLVQRVHVAQGRGVTGKIRIDWADLIRFKKAFTDPVPATRKEVFAREGIDDYPSHARFTGSTTIATGDRVLRGRFIGIATGAVPRKLGIPGEEHVSTSEDFLAMGSLPGRIVFIGGGFISFEFASVAAAAGARVTILQRGRQVLKEFDPFLVGILVRACHEQGIEVVTGMPVQSVEKDGDGFRVTAGNLGDRSFIADMVVHGAGRVPDFDGLDLAAGGVQVDERGNVMVNRYLQSVSNPSVYIAGDAKAKALQLSPVATLEGLAAVKNMLHGNHIAPDYTAVASVVFTTPPLASVGLREDQAVARGIRAVVSRQETPDWYSNRRVGITHAGYTILTGRDSGKILGAHFLGYNADELVNVFALAIRTGTTLAELQDIPWAYPTAGYDIIRIR